MINKYLNNKSKIVYEYFLHPLPFVFYMNGINVVVYVYDNREDKGRSKSKKNQD